MMFEGMIGFSHVGYFCQDTVPGYNLFARGAYKVFSYPLKKCWYFERRGFKTLPLEKTA